MGKNKEVVFEVPVKLVPSLLKAIEPLGLWITKSAPIPIVERTYFDSFDWRLFAKKYLLFTQSDQLHLQHQKSIETRRMPFRKSVGLASDLPSGEIASIVAPICPLRRLFPKLACQIETTALDLVDRLEKTVLRLRLELYRCGSETPLLVTLRLIGLKGYETSYDECLSILKPLKLKKLKSDISSILFSRTNLDTRSAKQKISLQIAPQETLASSLRQQLILLLRDVERHAEGIVHDWDTEFLHQFRVGIRRSRSLLSYFGKLLPIDETMQAKAILRRWGTQTNGLRDLDVLLLDETYYFKLLPSEIATHLKPFFQRLRRRRQRYKRVLSQQLQAPGFKKDLQDLRNLYRRMDPSGREDPQLPLTTKLQLVLKKKFKRVKRAVHYGLNGAPESELHSLRIQLKKVRYILAGFESLFPGPELKQALSHLKNCQDVLGTRHDYEWQINTILDASVDGSQSLPLETQKAMAMLAGVIHANHLHQWQEVKQGLEDLAQTEFTTLVSSLKCHTEKETE